MVLCLFICRHAVRDQSRTFVGKIDLQKYTYTLGVGRAGFFRASGLFEPCIFEPEPSPILDEYQNSSLEPVKSSFEPKFEPMENSKSSNWNFQYIDTFTMTWNKPSKQRSDSNCDKRNLNFLYLFHKN